MAQLYKRFLGILQNWPLCPEYPPPFRSLPEHIRQQGKNLFSPCGDVTGDTKLCEKHLASLERLTQNHWLKAYPHNSITGALGLPPDHCRIAMTNEYLEFLNQSRLSVLIQQLRDLFRKGAGEGKA